MVFFFFLVPGAAPSIVRVSSTSSSLSVVWTALSDAQWNGPKRVYVVTSDGLNMPATTSSTVIA